MATVQTPTVDAPATPAAVAPELDTIALNVFLRDVCTALRDATSSPTYTNLFRAAELMETLSDWHDERETATLHAAKGEPRTLAARGWYRCLAKIEASSSAIIRYNARKAS